MGEDNEFNCIKIAVVGDSGCGKSCLIQRFISDTFPEVKELLFLLNDY